MILLFIGAGGSAAVSDILPTTKGFFELLETGAPEIWGSPWFQNACEFLGSENKTEEGKEVVVDIEQVLWRMQEFIDCFSDLADSHKFVGWMASSSSRMESVGHRASHWDPREFSSAKDSLTSVRNTIWRKVHEVYGIDNGKEFYQTNLWSGFIYSLLQKGHQPLEILTTNYDKVFEGIILHNDLAVEDGMVPVPGGNMVLDMARRQRPFKNGTIGRLTKLHGSTNWRRVGEQEIQCTDIIGRVFDPDDMAILYPGIKGGTSKEMPFPFGAFYDDLKYVSRTAGKLIFVGYSFRDDQINEILEESIEGNLNDHLGEGPTIIVIDKDPSRKMPEVINKNAHIVRREFNQKSVKDCLALLEGKRPVRTTMKMKKDRPKDQDDWNQVVESFKDTEPSLYDALVKVVFVAADEHTLTLHLTPENAAAKSKLERNSESIEKALELITGERVTIEASELQEA